MASATSSNEAAIYSINVTPLVDITLVLLIIMMVTAKLIVSQALPMDVPLDGTASPGGPPKYLTVNIHKDGTILLNETAIDNARQFHSLALAYKRDTEDPRAIIQADAKSKHGSVVEVIDWLKRVGISRVAFAAHNPGK